MATTLCFGWLFLLRVNSREKIFLRGEGGNGSLYVVTDLGIEHVRCLVIYGWPQLSSHRLVVVRCFSKLGVVCSIRVMSYPSSVYPLALVVQPYEVKITLVKLMRFQP